ncbi:MAG: hypothetical protein EZS28_034878 [Streblomastix strix]|uniref:Uncharacterized protein n=1 Tax=Streblomastix strix TaxID=222440 RepID=A0A5J4UJ27_9EUKA|nr:MAG: hypothetical protein EZS28_034878 [Streblomastix strix]
MSNIGMQIISSESDEDFVQWKTTIPSVRIICSLPALTTQEWTNIYAAVGRAGFYGQFIAEVVSEWSAVEHIGVASPWKFRFI